MRSSGIRPIDVAEVSKGDYFSADEVAQMYGKRVTDADFWVCMLQLKDYIESRSDMRCRQLNGGLQVMTDLEFVDYNWAMIQRIVARLVVRARDTAIVNTSGFNAKQRALHDSRSAAAQITAMAAHGALKKACSERKLFGPRDLMRALSDGEPKEESEGRVDGLREK